MALVSYTQPDSGKVQFTMNKNELLNMTKVINDPVFALESNWFRVSFVFKHTTSGKRFVPSFRTFSATKYLKIRNGMSGGDGFELKKIIISKSDRTFLVIKTSEIPSVTNYTFSLMSSGGGGGGSTSQTFTSWVTHPNNGSFMPFTLLPDGGIDLLQGESYSGAVGTSMSGDFEVSFETNSTPTTNWGLASNGVSFIAISKNNEDTAVYSITGGSDSKWTSLQNGEIFADRGTNDKITYKRVGNVLRLLVNDILVKSFDLPAGSWQTEPLHPYIKLEKYKDDKIVKSYKV